MSSHDLDIVREKLGDPGLMVVEDDKATLDLYEIYLDSFPVEVNSCRDMEGVQSYLEGPETVDAVITDYELIRSNGAEVIEEVGKKGEDYVNTALVTSRPFEQLDDPGQDIYAEKGVRKDSFKHLAYLVLVGSAYEKAVREEYDLSESDSISKVQEGSMNLQKMFDRISDTIENLQGEVSHFEPREPSGYLEGAVL